MTAQRAGGTDEGGEAEEERHALARLLGGSAREPVPARPRAELAPLQASAPARPARARFELRAARAPGVFGARFLAHDLEHDSAEAWVERLEEEPARGAEFEPRFATLARALAPLAGVLPWTGCELDARGRRLVAQPARAGETLRELLERRGTLPPEHAFEILRQVLRVLEAAHAHGLAHGSLVPEHVRLAARSPWSPTNPFGVEVELAAFGLAGLLGGQAHAHDDLRQAEELLAELVTGSTDVAGLTARLPRHAARRLGRLGTFASAAEFRAALGAPSGVPRGARTWVVAAALALAGLAALSAWRSQRALARERERAGSAERAEEAARQDARARAVLERFLGLLEEGADDEARLVLGAAQAEAPLRARGFGTGFLEAALDARAALGSTGPSELVARAERLLRARDALADARARREAFLVAGTEWLAHAGTTRAAPRAELLRWFEDLEGGFAPRAAALERELARAAEGLLVAEPEARTLLVLARWLPARIPALRAGVPAEGAHALRLTLLEDESLLGRLGERSLWRIERPDGTVTWREERVVARHAGGARIVRRGLEGTPGTGAEELWLGWRGTALVHEPAAEAALELASPLRASHFVPRPDEPVPAEFPAEGAAALRATLSAGTTFELTSGTGRAWLCAGLGLVRRVQADGTVLELAWRGGP